MTSTMLIPILKLKKVIFLSVAGAAPKCNSDYFWWNSNIFCFVVYISKFAFPMSIFFLLNVREKRNNKYCLRQRKM